MLLVFSMFSNHNFSHVGPYNSLTIVISEAFNRYELRFKTKKCICIYARCIRTINNSQCNAALTPKRTNGWSKKNTDAFSLLQAFRRVGNRSVFLRGK